MIIAYYRDQIMRPASKNAFLEFYYGEITHEALLKYSKDLELKYPQYNTEDTCIFISINGTEFPTYEFGFED